jgi:hypothetical protein
MFTNTKGIELVLDLAKTKKHGKSIYEVTMPRPPLQFSFRGNVYQPDRHYFSDLGSTPGGIGKDEYLFSFLMHDSGYQHKGLFLWQFTAKKFTFHPMNRKEIDDLLYEMILVEGRMRGEPYQAKLCAPVIWSAVRMFGGIFWDGKIKW